MQYKLFTLVLLPLFAFSCGKKDIKPIPETPVVSTPRDSFELEWSVPISEDTMLVGNETHLFYGNKVILAPSYQYYSYFVIFDTETGKKLWEWPAAKNLPTLYGTFAQKDNLVFFASEGVTYCIDMETMSVVWINDIGYSGSTGSRIEIFGDYLYNTQQIFGNHSDSEVCHLVRTGLLHDKWDTIYSQPIRDNYVPSLASFTGYVDQNGDSILIFQNRQVNFYTLDAQIDLIALNLRTREKKWEALDIEPTGNSGIQQGGTKVWEGKFYFSGGRYIYCYDAETGEQIWKRTFDPSAHLLIFPLVLEQNRLMVTVMGDPTFSAYLLNPNTGELYYSIREAGGAGCQMGYHNNLVYTGGYKLSAIDIRSGEYIWNQLLSPNYSWNVNCKIESALIDPVTEKLFVTDERFLMKMKPAK